MQIGVSSKRRGFWKPLIQRIQQKLFLGKHKLLSMVGILQFIIKSVLNNHLMYFISLFKLLNSVVKKMISVQIKFFQGGNDQQASKLEIVHGLAQDRIMKGVRWSWSWISKLKNLVLLLNC